MTANRISGEIKPDEDLRTAQGVTIIGLGPMGQAMVKVFLEKEYEVTVWNRTASKTDTLVTQGAIRAET